MFRSSAAFVPVLASLLAIAGGCSSGSEGGSGAGAVSSVDSSKRVDSLSDAEAKQYCEDGQSYTTSQMKALDTKRIGCGFTAQFTAGIGAQSDADAQAKCRTQFDECMNKPDDAGDAGTGDAETDDSCASFKNQTQGCSATVGEMNQCVADQIAALKALAGKDFCADAKVRTQSDQPGSPVATPASCTALASKCPSLFGGTDDSSNGG
ncbi:hypothetical protein AKJ09_03168 [Labilithrix luteola]|uniref:Secreted protein n=1 Tax=Labilithrix luteola TaxID=1391654 RepID=A0A0K1PTP3_9BACT|nr:hypothetical protein AKJ09_03168 [Labilithrix luteola]